MIWSQDSGFEFWILNKKLLLKTGLKKETLALIHSKKPEKNQKIFIEKQQKIITMFPLLANTTLSKYRCFNANVLFSNANL